jgi:hypothetical protein
MLASVGVVVNTFLLLLGTSRNHANPPAALTPLPEPENVCTDADSRTFGAVGDGLDAGNMWFRSGESRLADPYRRKINSPVS